MTATTTRQPASPAGARWMRLLRPRWLAWHSFVIIAAVGMIFLGDWQLHRAESGNELSWAYTFEWPLFSIFTVFFWIKSLRDELRDHGEAQAAEVSAARPGQAGATSSAESCPAATGGQVVATGELVATTTGETAGTASGPPAGPAETAASAGRRADSWDATSWDAASWEATGAQPGADGTGKPADLSRATPADGEAYVARLMAEVQRSGRGRSRR